MPNSTTPELPPAPDEPHRNLRQRAEQALDLRADTDQLSLAESRQLVYELHVHQIELELQNEELRAAQAALETSRTRYFALYDLAPVGYVTLNPQGIIQEANLTAAQLLQAARSDLLFQPLTRFIAAADQDRYYHHQRLLGTTGMPQVSNLRMRSTDDQLFWVRLESNAVPIAVGDPVSQPTYLTVFSDITAQIQAEEALRELNATLEQRVETQIRVLSEREERWRALIDASAQIVWTTDAAGRAIEESPSWQAFTGQSITGHQGQGWLDAVHPADQAQARDTWQAAIAQTTPLDNVVRLRHHGGDWRWMWVRAVPLRTAEGTVRGWVAMNSDITVRKQAEQQLRANETAFRALSHRLLETQETERRTLAAELHDELGQLLTGLNLLLMVVNPHDAPAKIAAQVEQAQQILGELTQQVRRISLDLRPPMLDDLGLHTTLEWFITRYRDQTQVSVDFYSQVATQRFPHAVELAVYRIVQEALTNIARHAAASRIAVRLWSKPTQLGLLIEDNGQGFDQAAPLAYSSSGIASMRERAVLLGGSFTIESTPGKGTSILAYVPLTPSTAAPQEEAL